MRLEGVSYGVKDVRQVAGSIRIELDGPLAPGAVIHGTAEHPENNGSNITVMRNELTKEGWFEIRAAHMGGGGWVYFTVIGRVKG